MPEDKKHSTRVTWIQDLLDRRVPQILGLYLGAGWAMIQFIAWLTERYDMAANLPDLALVITLSLIPTVIMLAYFHGRPGRIVGSRWTRVEKIGIPVNVVLSGLLVILVASSGESDAATQTVTLTDETGQQIERVVPQQEYRRSLVLFGFLNEAEDPELAWLEDGIAGVLGLDLLQDVFLDLRSPTNGGFRDKVGGAGFTNGARIPVALQRKITREFRNDHFLHGSFRKAADTYVIRTDLYDAERGKLLAENEVEGEDLLALIDRLAVQLKRDLGLPEEHIENAQDLPVAGITTRSVSALEDCFRGVRALVYDRDPDAASDLLERAIAADPSFSAAAWFHSLACAARGDRGCTLNSLDLAMEHLYKLPERLKFEVKDSYYFHNEEHDKHRRLVEMRIELFPQDIVGYLQLAEIYAGRSEWDQALDQYERALEIAPEPELYFEAISSVYLRQGNVEKARDYIERYVEHFADDAESYIVQAEFFEELNDYDAARASYEKARLLDPGKIGVLLSLGDVERNRGQLELATEHYSRALERAKRARDKAEVYDRLATLYQARGQMARAVKYLEQKWQEREKHDLPGSYTLNRLFSADHYVQAGRLDLAWKLVEELAPRLEPPLNQLVPILYLRMYNSLGDVAKAEEELVKTEAVFEAQGDRFSGLRSYLPYERGRTLEVKGDFVAAIESFQQSLTLDSSLQQVFLDLGRAQRKAGHSKDALESLEKAFATASYDPRVSYELGLTYASLGDERQAREHLQRAVEMWSEADPEYAPAQEARARLALLDGAA